jgi:uncharacterized membrane protein YozB (DUF420 family)
MIDELFHTPGFFGTHANFFADVTLVAMLVTATLFSVGFYLARKDNLTGHKWTQTLGALINLILVLWMMILPYRDFIIQDQGGPRENFFYNVTMLHAFIGLSATIFGLYVVLRGYNIMPKFLRFHNYKPFMRAAYSLYLAATLLGVAVYLAWYVFTELPPTY